MPQGLDEVSAVILDDKMYMIGKPAWRPQTSSRLSALICLFAPIFTLRFIQPSGLHVGIWQERAWWGGAVMLHSTTETAYTCMAALVCGSDV